MKTTQVLLIMKFTVWATFIGLCIQTGAILYSFFISIFVNPAAAKNLYLGLNLSGLYNYNAWHFAIIMLLVICLSCLKTYITYSVLQIILKTNFVHPFSTNIAALIKKISYVAFGIGVLAVVANAYSEWLIKKGIAFNDLQNYLSGGPEFLFFAGILFIIAQVFNRGIEIQSENELTI